MQSKSRSFKRSLDDAQAANDDADAEESDTNTAVMQSSRNAAGNAFREKRQSDPQIRYAFCNRGFEEFARSRRHSAVHHGEWQRRSATAMPNINEYSFEEDFELYRAKEWPVNSLTAINADDVVPVPRLKIRVCEERGHSVDAGSFESTSSGEYSDSYCEMGGGRMSQDGDRDDDDWFEETYFYDHSEYADPFAGNRRYHKRDARNANNCAKCGHKCLVKQFTNSFEAWWHAVAAATITSHLVHTLAVVIQFEIVQKSRKL